MLLQDLDPMAEGKYDTAVSRPLVCTYLEMVHEFVCHPLHIYTYTYVLPSPHTVHVHESYTIPEFMAITEGNRRQRIMAEIDSSIACVTGTL